MPAVADETELQFARSVFEGMSPVWSDDPRGQLGAWKVYQQLLQKWERTYIWPFESVATDLHQSHRAFLTSVLSMGEHLLTVPFGPKEKEFISANVRFLRDKLVMEFSDVSEEESAKLLESIFGPGTIDAE